jgi:hypothetical protein
MGSADRFELVCDGLVSAWVNVADLDDEIEVSLAGIGGVKDRVGEQTGVYGGSIHHQPVERDELTQTVFLAR